MEADEVASEFAGLCGHGFDSERYTGRAFGFGIERLAMRMCEISDIRRFSENDLGFLDQF